MKISYWVPSKVNSQRAIDFIGKEINEAYNIKSKKNREETLSALRKIETYIGLYGSGYTYLSAGPTCMVSPYEGNKKLYNCGRDFIYYSEEKPYK